MISVAMELTRALGGGQWHGSYGTARCPSHDDRNPSLSIRDAKDGRLLVRCHGPCDQDSVIQALKVRGLWSNSAEAIAHFRPAQGGSDNHPGERVELARKL